MAAPPFKTLSDPTAAALEQAWEEVVRDGTSLAAKSRLALLLRRNPDAIEEWRGADLIQALGDFDLDPVHLSDAGWSLVLRRLGGARGSADDVELDSFARQLDNDMLCIKLLNCAPVFVPEAEFLLTALRCRMLLAGTWEQYPRLWKALVQQARINGGAWPISPEEFATLEQADGHIKAAFDPPVEPSPASANIEPSDRVTREVKALYERWPYPAWQRITREPPWTLPEMMRTICPSIAEGLPNKAEILVAGCGTGRQAALVASEFPDAAITAIDISEASIAYAGQQCEAIGISRVRFQVLDIHEAAKLDRQFDAIFCDGVLHHMPDPAAGLRALLQVLQPRGAIRLSLYSKIARMPIEGAMKPIRHLMGQELSVDLLREARKILLSHACDPAVARIMTLRDFATLQGFADMLFHPQSDLFDIPRIARMMADHGLTILSFNVPSRQAEAYARENPHDPLAADLAAVQAFELRNPLTFLGMYSFWCARA